MLLNTPATPAPVITAQLAGPVVPVLASTPTLAPAVPAAVRDTAAISATGLPAESRASGTGLARTGSDTRTMIVLALMALLVGCLSVLLSQRPSGRFQRDVSL